MFVRSISATRNHFSSVFQGQAWPLPMRSCLLLGAKSEHTWSSLYTDLQGILVLRSGKYKLKPLKPLKPFSTICLVEYFSLDVAVFFVRYYSLHRCFTFDISRLIFLVRYLDITLFNKFHQILCFLSIISKMAVTTVFSLIFFWNRRYLQSCSTF